jgi:hypothetical protein
MTIEDLVTDTEETDHPVDVMAEDDRTPPRRGLGRRLRHLVGPLLKNAGLQGSRRTRKR